MSISLPGDCFFWLATFGAAAAAVVIYYMVFHVIIDAKRFAHSRTCCQSFSIVTFCFLGTLTPVPAVSSCTCIISNVVPYCMG